MSSKPWSLFVIGERPGLCEYHVIPEGDTTAHSLASACWCRPTCHEVGNVWTHHSLDRRELLEPGALPPAVRH